MSGLLERGIFFFNEARYFDAHEAWEDLWREDRTDLRLFYQGLIQAAAGLHHLTRQNPEGARAQLSKSLQKLATFPPEAAGIDLNLLRQDLRKVLDHMDPEGLRAVRIVLQSGGRF